MIRRMAMVTLVLLMIVTATTWVVASREGAYGLAHLALGGLLIFWGLVGGGVLLPMVANAVMARCARHRGRR